MDFRGKCQKQKMLQILRKFFYELCSKNRLSTFFRISLYFQNCVNKQLSFFQKCKQKTQVFLNKCKQTSNLDMGKLGGEQQTAMKRMSAEVEAERLQVKRLKEEIRRLTTQKQPSRDLDSTYVPASRPPLADKPIETICSNCQNKSNGQETAKKTLVLDDNEGELEFIRRKPEQALEAGLRELDEFTKKTIPMHAARATISFISIDRWCQFRCKNVKNSSSGKI